MKDKILLIATKTFGRTLMTFLTKQGFRSKDRIGGVQFNEVVNGVLKAIAIDGRPLDIDLDDYVVALVDGQLFGEFPGWEVVPLLTAAGIECIAISSNYHDRMRLKEKGARAFDDSLYMYAFLREGLRDLYEKACARKRSGVKAPE